MKSDIEMIVRILQEKYHIKVIRERPFKVLVHGILSTRTKDETTFPAQERLLRVADTPEKMLRLPAKRIEKLIYPVGFYKTKARLIREACSTILVKFGGKVPDSREQLMEIPGVGPKVASLVMVWGFGIPTIPVDIHVNRISQRLGLVKKDSRPEDTQEILEKIVPQKSKMVFNRLFVLFGKDICRPTRPHCFRCPIYSYCRFEMKEYCRGHVPAKWVNVIASRQKE